MPWGPEDAVKHNSKAKGYEKLWARTATGALRSTGDDGKAIRIANAAVNKARARRGK